MEQQIMFLQQWGGAVHDILDRYVLECEELGDEEAYVRFCTRNVKFLERHPNSDGMAPLEVYAYDLWLCALQYADLMIRFGVFHAE